MLVFTQPNAQLVQALFKHLVGGRAHSDFQFVDGCLQMGVFGGREAAWFIRCQCTTHNECTRSVAECTFVKRLWSVAIGIISLRSVSNIISGIPCVPLCGELITQYSPRFYRLRDYICDGEANVLQSQIAFIPKPARILVRVHISGTPNIENTGPIPTEPSHSDRKLRANRLM